MYSRAEKQAYQERRLREITALLSQTVGYLRDHPGQLADLFAFKGSFFEYSIDKTILIARQQPRASFVATYDEWKSMGFFVRAGQHGITVLEPVSTRYFTTTGDDGRTRTRPLRTATQAELEQIRNGELTVQTGQRFTISVLFDIAQTTCPPEDYFKYRFRYSPAQHASLLNALERYAKELGLKTVYADISSVAADSFFDPYHQSINIAKRLAASGKLAAMADGLGRALAARENGRRSPVVIELEADAIGIALQSHFGIPMTQDRRTRFVTHYDAFTRIDTDCRLKEVLDDINASLRRLHFSLLPYLQPIQKQRENEVSASPVPETGTLQGTFSFQVDKALTGRYSAPQPVRVGNTPVSLQQAGLPPLPLLIPAGHLSSMVHAESPENPHWHGLDVSLVKLLPQLLETPAMAVRSWTQEQSFLAVLDAVDSQKRPILVPIKPNSRIQTGETCNLITSMYGRSNFLSYESSGNLSPRCFLSLANLQNNLLFLDEGKCRSLFSKMGLVFPSPQTTLGRQLRQDIPNPPLAARSVSLAQRLESAGARTKAQPRIEHVDRNEERNL